MRDAVWGQTVRLAGQTGCTGHDGRAKPAWAACTGLAGRLTVSEGHGYPLVFNKHAIISQIVFEDQGTLVVLDGYFH
jgi:hypothetical protein